MPLTYTAVFDVEKAVKIRCGKIHWSGELLFVIEKHLIIRIGEQPVQFVVILGQSEAFIVFAKKGSVCAKVLVAPQMLRFVADDDVIVLLGDVDRGNDIILILSGNTAKNAFELLARCGIGIDKAYFFVRKSGVLLQVIKQRCSDYSFAGSGVALNEDRTGMLGVPLLLRVAAMQRVDRALKRFLLQRGQASEGRVLIFGRIQDRLKFHVSDKSLFGKFLPELVES